MTSSDLSGPADPAPRDRIPTFIRTCTDECGRYSDEVDIQGNSLQVRPNCFDLKEIAFLDKLNVVTKESKIMNRPYDGSAYAMLHLI